MVTFFEWLMIDFVQKENKNPEWIFQKFQIIYPNEMKFKTCMCPPVLCPFTSVPFWQQWALFTCPQRERGLGCMCVFRLLLKGSVGIDNRKNENDFVCFFVLFFLFLSLKMSFHLGFPKEVLVFIVFSFPFKGYMVSSGTGTN